MDIAAQIIKSENWTDAPPSPKIGRILKRWRTTRNGNDTLRATAGSCIIAQIIASVTKHDDTWKALARSHLDVTGEVLEGYLQKEKTVLLANLTKTTHLIFEHKHNFKGILGSISKFSVEGTLPNLQQEFYTLWKRIDKETSSSSDRRFILEETRPVYDALRRSLGTESTVANGDSASGHAGPSHSPRN